MQAKQYDAHSSAQSRRSRPNGNSSLERVTGENITFNAEHDAVKKGYLLTIENGKYQIWDQKAFN